MLFCSNKGAKRFSVIKVSVHSEMINHSEMETKVQNDRDFWSEYSIPESTPMRNFYRGKTIFLTGGTGDSK